MIVSVIYLGVHLPSTGLWVNECRDKRVNEGRKEQMNHQQPEQPPIEIQGSQRRHAPR